jgi:L-ascorbate metabolism protein UlaG (beta-lactamase superfamily)
VSSRLDDQVHSLSAQLIGGPTLLLQYAGLRWLTDPTLSPPGHYGWLDKTAGPALDPGQLEPVDVVLLSHDQHPDNLDPAGRSFLPRAGRVLTTTPGAQRLGANAIGIAPWASEEVPAPGEKTVTVTAVPAQHGPDGSDEAMGPVTGFILHATGSDSVYVSGDNASLDIVRDIAKAYGPIDIAVLFAGAVQRDEEFEGAYLTLSSDRAAEAARILGARHAIPAHYEGWTHFTQGAAALRAAFAGNQVLDRLVLLSPGERAELQRPSEATGA